jgi:hypothetical protein
MKPVAGLNFKVLVNPTINQGKWVKTVDPGV